MDLDLLPLFVRAERAAGLLLRRHWPRVERLAALLVQARRLEGEALSATLEGLGTRLGARQRWAELYSDAGIRTFNNPLRLR